MLNDIIIPYKSEYVQGHQDRCNTKSKQTKDGLDNIITSTKQQQHRLKWEARLNVVADDLATAAYGRLKHKNKRKLFYEYPAA
eukprot:11603183-Ditylum_brightwellii.AAC.1